MAELSVNEYINDILNSISDNSVTESAVPTTKLILDTVYPKVEKTLSTSIGSQKFKTMVGSFMDRNHSKLHTVGPQYMIAFTDKDKAEYFALFNINPKEVINTVTEVTKSIGNNSKFIYLRQNPILFVLWACIRYYYIKKDDKGLNTALAIYALAVYPSVYSAFFKYPPNPDVMKYTIDHMSEKWFIKQTGSIFAALYKSINNSFQFLKQFIIKGDDGEVIRFVQRIRSDQKSMMRNICDAYMKNYKEGLRTSQSLDSALNNNDLNSIDTLHENNSTIVDSITNKVSIPIITNGVNLQIVSQAKDIAGISLADCRYYISKIVTDKHSNDIREFIHAILFRFLYDDKHYPQDINSKEYLVYCGALFRQTNSKNDNIKTIKDLLDKWAEEVGIHAKFKREASRVNYKKAIFFYFILSIQFYNNH